MSQPGVFSDDEYAAALVEFEDNLKYAPYDSSKSKAYHIESLRSILNQVAIEHQVDPVRLLELSIIESEKRSSSIAHMKP
jgi:hypothetical protein